MPFNALSLPETVFLFGVLAAFGSFIVSLFSVWIYVNARAVVQPAPQDASAIEAPPLRIAA